MTWDALLLQEITIPTQRHIPAWLQGGAKFEGHKVVANPGKFHDTAILLHKRHGHRSIAAEACAFGVSVAFSIQQHRFALASIHAPDTWTASDGIYEKAWDDVSDMFQQLQVTPRDELLVGWL